MSGGGVLNALEFLQAMSADRIYRTRSSSADSLGKLKKVYVRRKNPTPRCRVCRGDSFSKYGRGEQGFFCLRIVCDRCKANSYLVLDEKLCENCENRVDCLSEEIELVTAEIICLLI